MKKFTRISLFVLTVLSLLLSACGSGETYLAPNDPNTIANGGSTVSVYTGCPLVPGLSLCKSASELEGVQLAGVDAAVLATLATPWPGDEEVAAVVWAGDKVIKLYLYLTAAYLANNAIEYTVHEVVSGQVVEIQEAWEPHNQDHNIDRNISAVTVMITGYQTWVSTGGPKTPQTNQDFACRVVKVAGVIKEYVLWQKSGEQLLVFGADGAWTTYYTGKTWKTLMNPPKKYRAQGGKMETFGCDQFPPFPPLPS